MRQIAEREELPFIIALSERPWELPLGLTRPDSFDALWHLDVPDAIARAQLFDQAAQRLGHLNPTFDSVVMARIAHDFLPSEIFAAYRKATLRSDGMEPSEQTILAAINEIEVFTRLRSKELSLMTNWAKGIPVA